MYEFILSCFQHFPIITLMALAYIVPVLLAIVAELGCSILSWIDDGEKVYLNPVMTALIKLFRYERKGGVWVYYKIGGGAGSDGPILFFYLWMLLSSIILTMFYPEWFLPLWVMLAVIFVARFVKRLSKKFSLHVKDKNAHS